MAGGVASPGRTRDLLLVLLAVTTGSTDATAFEQLGHVFASVITGNLILLGASAVLGDGRVALFCGCALAGYALGVLLAAPGRDGGGGATGRSERRAWPPGATAALALEVAVLAAFAIAWELTAHQRGEAGQAVTLALAGTAMGVQSTAVRRLGPMSTTYLTSTLTGLLEALRARSWTAAHARSLGILVTALAGAAAGTALILNAPRLLPLLQLLPLVTVIAVARRLALTANPGSP